MIRSLVVAASLVACKSKSDPAPPPTPVAAAPRDARVVDAAALADAAPIAIEPTWFDEVETFANGRIGVRVGEKWGLVDAKGHMLVPVEYDLVTNLAAEPVAWLRKDKTLRLFTGTNVIETKALRGTGFADGVAMLQLDHQWRFIGLDAKPIGTAAYASATQLARCPLWTVEPLPVADDAGAAGPCVIDKHRTCVAAKKLAGQGPFVVSDGQKLGMIDCHGAVVVPFAYDDIKLVEVGSSDRAWVHDGGWGLVDHGKLVIPTKLPAMPKEIRDGVVSVKDNDGKWWLADLGGHVLAPGAWDISKYLSDGLAFVRVGKKWGIASSPDGKLVVEPTYDEVGLVSEHRVPVKQDGRWGYLDDHGTVAIAPSYYEASYFADGFAVVRGKGGYGYIDVAGNVVLEPTLDAAGSVRDGLAFASRDNGTNLCIVFTAGKPPAVKKTAFAPAETSGVAFHGGVSIIYNGNNGCGYIGPRCAELTAPDAYELCDDLDAAGYAIVTEKPEPIATDATTHASPTYGSAEPLPEPPRKLDLIDGKLAVVTTGEVIERLAPGVFVVADTKPEQGGHPGLLVRGKQTIAAGLYDEIEDARDGFVSVRRGQKWALVQLDGTPLVVTPGALSSNASPQQIPRSDVTHVDLEDRGAHSGRR